MGFKNLIWNCILSVKNWIIFFIGLLTGLCFIAFSQNLAFTYIQQNFIVPIFIGFGTGIITIYLTARYVTNFQIATQINDDLAKCFADIEKNKKKMSKEALASQYEIIRKKVAKKKRLLKIDKTKALELYPAFDKEEYDFSHSNFYQYLLVDNIKYFLSIHASHYPKNYNDVRSNFRAMIELFEVFDQINHQFAIFETPFLIEINSLLLNKDNKDSDYQRSTESHIKEINKYFEDKSVEINKLIDQIRFPEMKIRVKFLSGEFY
jgi:hypothetical protein